MPVFPVRTGTEPAAHAVVSSVAKADPAILPLLLLFLLPISLPMEKALSAPNTTDTAISPIFRHIPIPMPLFPIWKKFLRKPCPPLLSVGFPSPQDRTVCRRMFSPCWEPLKSVFPENLSGWSLAYRQSTKKRQILSAGDILCPVFLMP